MRIGILTKSIDESPAGIGRYTFNLVKNLTKIDKKNQYFFIHYKKNGNKFYKDKNEILIKKYSLPKIINDSIAFLFFDKYKLDLVHEPSLINFLLPTKFKTIVTVHDIFFLISEKNKIKRLFLNFLYKTILYKTDKIIVDSESTKKDLVKYFNINELKITVIYAAVCREYKVIKNRNTEAKRMRKKYHLSFPFILFVGTLEPRKNLPRLIEAFHKLKIRNSFKHKLVIVGKKGWNYKNIFEIINKLGEKENVVFTGYIPDEDLIFLYNTASLFVFPSLYEGFGLPVLEAMACGCPVICSNTSSLPEVAGGAAMMIDPYKVEALINAMEKMLIDENLRKSMIEKGLKQVEKFSWINTARETLQVYNNIC